MSSAASAPIAATAPQAAAPTGHHGRSVALFLLGLVSVQLGWMLAVPAFFGIDEIDHVYRASSVARGHWQAGDTLPGDGRGFLIPVPDDIVAGAYESCSGLDYMLPDNCLPTTEPDTHGNVLIASAAANYNPMWYAVVGAAALPFEGDRAVIVMRLCSIVVCDLIVAAAMWLLLSRTRSGWATAGIALACTPVLIYATVNAAPNGWGYCAGLLLWVSMLTLPRDRTESAAAPMLGVAVSAPLIMATHSTGLLWVAMSLLCCGPLVLTPLRHLWSHRRVQLLLVALIVAASAIACAAWVLVTGTNDPREGDASDYGPVPAKTLLQGVILWPLQSIATLRTRGNAAPIEVYAIGVALLVIFVLLGTLAARRAERLTIGMVAISSLAIPIAATVLAYSQLGPAWQGRYGLSLSMGVVIVAAWALARSEGPGRVTAWALAMALAALQWLTITAMFREELAGAEQPWTRGFLVGGAAVTFAAFAMALTRASERLRDPS